MIGLYIIISVAFFCGYVLSGLLSRYKRQKLEDSITLKQSRINEQAEKILTIRKEMIEYKGAASSNELRADVLEKMKNDLQKDYDDLEIDFKMMFTDYKKLYIELDALKASEARKFRAPEEIIEEMINEHTVKILLELEAA